MATADALRATLEVTGVLEQLHVPYALVGSLASSVHGIPRSTHDADLVADLKLAHVESLVEALFPGFYIDRKLAREAVQRRGSFYAVHLESAFKVDIFVLRGDPLARQELARSQRLVVGRDGEEIDVASAEDTLLQKLVWVKIGAGNRERQWQDACGILKVQQGSLDDDYLRRVARDLDLTDLLGEAASEASPG